MDHGQDTATQAHPQADAAVTGADDLAFLSRAVELSWDHMLAGEGKPFGAVLVRDGVVLGEGWNAIVSTGDPTAHAEIMAVRRACEAVGSPDLTGSTLYASGEPCPMCLGAMFLARVSRCLYATPKEEATRIGNLTEAIYAEYPRPPAARSLPCIHVPLARASQAFDAWLAR
jgi:tRNA(Arg) A34 adenosine deaminase TadA